MSVDTATAGTPGQTRRGRGAGQAGRSGGQGWNVAAAPPPAVSVSCCRAASEERTRADVASSACATIMGAGGWAVGEGAGEHVCNITRARACAGSAVGNGGVQVLYGVGLRLM